MKYLRFIRLFFSLWGTSNYYEGVDKPTLIQWLYHWRMGPVTSWKVAKIIHL